MFALFVARPAGRLCARSAPPPQIFARASSMLEPKLAEKGGNSRPKGFDRLGRRTYIPPPTPTNGIAKVARATAHLSLAAFLDIVNREEEGDTRAAVWLLEYP
jgi:hypothetical protein